MEDAVSPLSREEMIIQNMPLVAFVVGRMADEAGSSPLDREEAIAYGVEGLIQAVDNYDPERGTTFASFAIRRIRGSVLDAIRRMDVLPRSLRRSTREVERANLELAGMLGRWPTTKELSLRMGLPLEDIRGAMGLTSARVISLEKMMTDRVNDGASPWEASDNDDLSDPAAQTDRQADLQLLNNAIGSLSPRDREIVQLRYGRNLPFHEIGKVMGLSESRVCQLHKRIIGSLRAHLKRELDAAA
jgi:RNA polymerase sigma factor for flagellar operon FliA